MERLFNAVAAYCTQLISKGVVAMALFFLTSLSVNAQGYIDEMAEKLGQKYEAVEYCKYAEIYCVKQNDRWEFADAEGMLLTDMHLASVSSGWFSMTITVGGVEYKVEQPVEKGRLLVNRYGRYAYMDKKGKLLTPFIYDGSGDETYNAEESDEFIRVNAAAEDFLLKAENVSSLPYAEILNVLTPANVLLLNDEYSTELTERFSRYALNSPEETDKQKIEALFVVLYDNDDCSDDVLKCISAYRYRTATDDETKFHLMEDIAGRITEAEPYTICGNMLRSGKGCRQDIQAAIRYYEQAVIEEGWSPYAENARQALREIWQADSTRYENRYGMLLSRYDDFRFYSGYLFVRNDGLTGLCDSTFAEILPCRYKNVKSIIEPLYAVETAAGVQLVTVGGKELTDDKYDDMDIGRFRDSTYVVFVHKDERWGILNEQGKPMTSMVFDEVSMPFFSFVDSYPKLTKNEEQYELICAFKSKRAIVRQHGRYGLMDTEGNIVVPCRYAYIEPFDDGATSTQARTEDDVNVTIKIK